MTMCLVIVTILVIRKVTLMVVTMLVVMLSMITVIMAGKGIRDRREKEYDGTRHDADFGGQL